MPATLLWAPTQAARLCRRLCPRVAMLMHSAGSALIDLAASAPGSSFLNNGLPTILVGFTVGCVPWPHLALPNTTSRVPA